MRGAAAFFGDDAEDARPLWFKKDAFMDDGFDPDAYIANLRSFVPLDTLRGELRSHLAALKAELVELINRDYNDFVNLSTNLVDVDAAVLRMRAPLQELKGKLVSVHGSVELSLLSVQDALKRRAEAAASREILDLLLHTSHAVSKVEKLLQELVGMRQVGAVAEADLSLEESRSRLLERIASEMNRLRFYVARAQDLPFIKIMETRIRNADMSLRDNLRRCFQLGLVSRDLKVLHYCLRAFAAIGDSSNAEEAFRATIVAPFVQKAVRPKAAVGGPEEKLDEMFSQIQQGVEEDCKFLLDIVSSEYPGLNFFDFLGNSILKEVQSAIQKGKPGALSPGRPDEFLESYKTGLKFLAFIEGHCQSESAIVKLRSQPAYSDFVKLWNLGVYFTLRFQEIAGSLEKTLTTDLLRQAEDDFAFQCSAKLVECLQRCWQDDVYTPALSDKFLKLSLQLIQRYSTWLSAGRATWSSSASPDDYLLLRRDVERLHERINRQVIARVLQVLAPVADEVLDTVNASIQQAAQSMLDIAADLTDALVAIISSKCCEVAKTVRTLTTTYRMSSKPVPTRHSAYASNILQYLKAFVDGPQRSDMNETVRQDIVTLVITKVTTYYEQQIRELVDSVIKTETSLNRFRRSRQKQGTGMETNDLAISASKVIAQVLLDAEEYARQMDALGVSSASLPAFHSLWQYAEDSKRAVLASQ